MHRAQGAPRSGQLGASPGTQSYWPAGKGGRDRRQTADSGSKYPGCYFSVVGLGANGWTEGTTGPSEQNPVYFEAPVARETAGHSSETLL